MFSIKKNLNEKNLFKSNTSKFFYLIKNHDFFCNPGDSIYYDNWNVYS